MEREKTTLFIPNGYGTGTIIRDLDGMAWRVGAVISAPIHEVNPIDENLAIELMKNPDTKLIVSK